MERPESWYAGTDARRIATVIVSFQTPAGGWSKNLDITGGPRAAGMLFEPHEGPDEIDPAQAFWNYVGTFDNDATTTQLRFLAKVITAFPGETNGLHTAFLHGIDYILSAQYPNGGWPQVWPLSGGYHDAITFNDAAMSNVLGLLQDMSAGAGEFAWVPTEVRSRAGKSCRLGIECVLAAQIVANGRHTVWAQQHDMLTLQPAPGRNYEMPAQVSDESTDVLLFLMRLPDPDKSTIVAVYRAMAWLEKNQMHGVAFKSVAGQGRLLVSEPGASPLWARYYQIESDRPIFGDRDKSIHDTVAEISRERRDDYAWYETRPLRAIRRFTEWKQDHPLPEAD